MGVAFVRGLQGNHPRYLKTAACAKHFAVHSGPEKLRHTFNVIPDEKDLRETYLPAFKALVDAGVEAVMCAYNRVNNAPCCSSNQLLRKILREEWRFRGHIVTDCWALDDIWLRHKVVKDRVEAAAAAARAGSNLNCGYIFKYLPQAVKRGLIREKTIDNILAPLLRSRFKLGLLDDSVRHPFANISTRVVNGRAHRDLAYKAAAESVVLLKNNGVLPLHLTRIKKIFLTGPSMADTTVLLGNYNGLAGNMVTFLEGIISRVDAGTAADYKKGCLINTPGIFNGTGTARIADVTIAAIGLSRFIEGEEGDALLSGYGGDRQSIGLPENQIELIRRLRKQAGNKPLIVIITGGSAIAIPEVEKLADAILYAWYPGEQGGLAVADIIFGRYNPAGRLPVTIYRSVKDLPPFTDYSMANRTYRYFRGTPLYPFGYGLSYSQFKYSGLQSDKKVYKKGDQIKLSLTVGNQGKYAGDEVVQCYVKGPAALKRAPIKSLKGIQRIHFKVGESKQIHITLAVQDLQYWDLTKKRYTVHPGPYDILIGSSSADIRLKKSIIIKGT
jgi:beta-glucosidase